MEEQEISFLDVDSYAEAIELLDVLHKNFLVLGKRIRRTMDELQEAMGKRLQTKLRQYGQAILEAFRVDSLENYYQAAAIYGSELVGTLYQLSGSFSGLKIAIIQAAAPIVQVLVPVVQLAVEALTGLIGSIGYVLQLLFQGGEASESYADGLYSTAAAGKAVQRSLAGFDQINRLNKKSSTGSGFTAYPQAFLTGSWKAFAEKLAELVEPLQKIDLTPLSKALEKLKKALEPITKALFEALEWAWYNIFVPMAQWAAEQLLPAFLEMLAAALEALARVIEELKPAFLWLWENYLKPLAQWKADQLIFYLQGLTAELNGTGSAISGSQSIVDRFLISGLTMIDTLAEMASEAMGVAYAGDLLGQSVWDVISGVEGLQIPIFGAASSMGLFGEKLLGLVGNFGLLKSSSDSTWSAVKTVWGNAWGFLKEKAMDPTYSGFRETANGIIGIINGILKGLTSGLNFIGSSFNKISFTLPSWVPVVGGKRFAFGFPQFETPQIPMLAKGAVLPANQPFLAVVGDQKRGTNVEAPLATIQEAVAAVMEDYTRANMTGHGATVEVLRQLLSAVLGIQIGDETIAAAVARYDRKMAVVRGGAV